MNKEKIIEKIEKILGEYGNQIRFGNVGLPAQAIYDALYVESYTYKGPISTFTTTEPNTTVNIKGQFVSDGLQIDELKSDKPLEVSTPEDQMCREPHNDKIELTVNEHGGLSPMEDRKQDYRIFQISGIADFNLDHHIFCGNCSGKIGEVSKDQTPFHYSFSHMCNREGDGKMFPYVRNSLLSQALEQNKRYKEGLEKIIDASRTRGSSFLRTLADEALRG